MRSQVPEPVYYGGLPCYLRLLCVGLCFVVVLVLQCTMPEALPTASGPIHSRWLKCPNQEYAAKDRMNNPYLFDTQRTHCSFAWTRWNQKRKSLCCCRDRWLPGCLRKLGGAAPCRKATATCLGLSTALGLVGTIASPDMRNDNKAKSSLKHG